jgi:hypothetical protein
MVPPTVEVAAVNGDAELSADAARGARMVVLRAAGYWLGWVCPRLTCSMTCDRL